MTNRKATVFLGGGRIAGALSAGLRLAGDEREVVVYDRHPEKLQALRRGSRVEAARDLKSAVERAEMLVIAVRPSSVQAMLEAVAACGAALPRLCVSLAAGIPLAKLKQSRAGIPRPHGAVRWVRAMPSPVCRVARGLTALCFDRGASKAERARVRAFFAKVGAVVEIPERQFDAFTAVFSSSHGYHALATLALAAERVGLDRATALTAAAHALGDSIAYWRESAEELTELLAEAATPGGTAAATIAAMDRSGYARVVERGIRAGVKRARLNAKQ